MRRDLPFSILNVLSSYSAMLMLEYVHFANNTEEVALSTCTMKKWTNIPGYQRKADLNYHYEWQKKKCNNNTWYWGRYVKDTKGCWWMYKLVQPFGQAN